MSVIFVYKNKEFPSEKIYKCFNENSITDELDISNSKCTSCKIQLDKQFCCFNNGIVCLNCKIKLNEQQFLKNPYQHIWKECNPQGKTYFVERLGQLHIYCCKKKCSFSNVFGEKLLEIHNQIFAKLYSFSAKEYNSYRFFPIDFSLLRFEREFAKEPLILDFWLTICCTYDLGNYLTDLRS